LKAIKNVKSNFGKKEDDDEEKDKKDKKEPKVDKDLTLA
jgi:hypothetical protein